MPLGENVGTAYVRLFIDGSGLDKDIRDEFDKAEPAYRKAARKHAKNYDDEFAEYLEEKGVSGDAMYDNLRKGLKEADFTRDFFNGPKWEAQKRSIANNFAELAPTMIKDLEDEFNKKGTLDGLAERIAQLNPVADDARRSLVNLANAAKKATDDEAIKKYNAEWAEAIRLNKEFDAALRKSSQDQDKQWQMHIRGLKDASDARDDFEREWRKTTDAINKDTDNMFADATRAVEDHGRAMDRTLGAYQRHEDALRRFFRDVRKVEHEVGDVQHGLRRYTDSFDRVTVGIGRFSNGIGRAFGKGSRNNFLNFVGSTVGGLINLTSVFSRLGGAITKVPELFGKLFGNAEGLGQVSYTLGSVMSGLAISLGTLAAGGAAAVAALAILGAIIGPLTALMSGLAGIVAALASTLAFGLVGAIAPVVGALLPLAAGVGVVALAFIGMTKAQKAALKVSMKPLTSEFKELSKVARDALIEDVPKIAENLAPVIKGMEPLVKGLAGAIGDIGLSWSKSMQGPGFTKFISVMTAVLPDMLRQIGDIAGNALGGIGGIFEGMMPITQQFLGWLSGITQEFSNWANSPMGQQQIVTFFEKAGSAAESLGGFLGDVWGLLATILDAGEKPGENIFDKMGKTIDGWSTYLKDNPDALKDWFKNAEDTAHDLGRLADALGRIFDELDNEENRKNLHEVMDLMVGLGKAAGATAGFLSRTTESFDKDFMSPLIDFFSGDSQLNPAGGNFLGIEKMMDGIFGFFEDTDWSGIWDGLTTSVEGVGTKIGTSFKNDFIGAITGWASGVGQSFMDDFITPIKNFFGGGGEGGGGMSLKAIKLPSPDISGWTTSIVNWFANLKLPKVKMPTLSDITVGIKWAMDKINWPTLPWWATKAIKIAWNVLKPAWPSLPSWATKAIKIAWNVLKPAWPKLPDWATSAIDIAWDIATPDWPDVPDWLKNVHIGFNLGSINWPKPPWKTASGGVFAGAQTRIIGEEGPEAVVPLMRPLSQVDPAVRELSAFAQGKRLGNERERRGTTIESGAITVISPASDARAVAMETLNYIAAAGY